jgi:GDP-4-dehydro-6-deoxy-D-mannose reductase
VWEYVAAVYAKGFQLDIINTRSFNHFGARQDTRFVLPGFAKQIVEIKKGNQEPVIHAGDVTVIRDFTDVRDVVRAYIALLHKGISGEIYNVCSGTGRTIQECVKLMMKIAGIDCEIRVEKKFMRPVDNPIIIGSNSKIKDHTGWFPEIAFDAALHHLLAQVAELMNLL